MIIHGKLQLFFNIMLLTFIFACSDTNISQETDKPNVAKMELLVSTQWLSENLDDPNLVVLDSTVYVKSDENGKITSVNGRAGYEAGHIPSAGFADLMGDMSASDDSLDFVMPTPQQFRQAMGALGVNSESRVVIYSAENPVWAARLWWMLRWAGFDNAALLDGGLKAWKNEGRPISTELPSRAPTQFTLALRPEVVADRDEVFAAINNNQVSIVDTLPDAHFGGEFTMYARPGHIPSATNMSSSDLLDKAGHYRSFDELEMMFEDDRNKRSITYCGGGIAASSVAFTMYRLGYTDVAVYMGSLQEWALNPENPMTTEVP